MKSLDVHAYQGAVITPRHHSLVEYFEGKSHARAMVALLLLVPWSYKRFAWLTNLMLPVKYALQSRGLAAYYSANLWAAMAALEEMNDHDPDGKDTSRFVAVETRIYDLGYHPHRMSVKALIEVVTYCFDIGFTVSETHIAYQPTKSEGWPIPPWWTMFHTSNALDRLTDLVENYPGLRVRWLLKGYVEAWLRSEVARTDIIHGRLIHLSAVLCGTSGPRPVEGGMFCQECGWRT